MDDLAARIQRKEELILELEEHLSQIYGCTAVNPMYNISERRINDAIENYFLVPHIVTDCKITDLKSIIQVAKNL